MVRYHQSPPFLRGCGGEATRSSAKRNYASSILAIRSSFGVVVPTVEHWFEEPSVDSSTLSHATIFILLKVFRTMLTNDIFVNTRRFGNEKR